MSINFRALEQWVPMQSRILDLGCGEGRLLQYLTKHRHVRALGVEIDHENMARCVEHGVPVVEQDIDQGLTNFSTNSFDVVLLTQTLQAVRRPDYVLEEMLRVGKECIVTFPNFAHWRARLALLMHGRMPVSKFMPHEWFDTPNIHFCTVKDFEVFCAERNIQVIDRFFQSGSDVAKSAAVTWQPNWRAVNAIYRVTRR